MYERRPNMCASPGRIWTAKLIEVSGSCCFLIRVRCVCLRLNVLIEINRRLVDFFSLEQHEFFCHFFSLDFNALICICVSVFIRSKWQNYIVSQIFRVFFAFFLLFQENRINSKESERDRQTHIDWLTDRKTRQDTERGREQASKQTSERKGVPELYV